MNRNRCKISAPASDLEQAARLLEAGADELYCGILPDDWIRRFSDADFLTRRQGTLAHFSRWESLKEAIDLVHEAGREIFLTLNQRYSPVQEKYVLAALRKWESLGGDALIVADPGLLRFLNGEEFPMRIHLSLMVGVYNSSSANFFRKWKIDRIVLPRELSVEEIGDIVAKADSSLQFEALVLHQKCRFIDGACGFYHGTRQVGKSPASLDSIREPGEELCVFAIPDPLYEGHGCHIEWTGPDGPVRPSGPEPSPSCAACALPPLFDAGVRHFKLAGRGYPTEILVDSIRFIEFAIDAWDSGTNPDDARESIKRAYAWTFGRSCDSGRCYYSK